MKQARDHMPPMLGLPEEEVCASMNFMHYTAVLNGKRVFVFPVRDEPKWIIEVDDNTCGPQNDEYPDFFFTMRNQHTVSDDDPVTLLSLIYALTSGGNIEGPHGHQGARPIEGDASLGDKKGGPRVDRW